MSEQSDFGPSQAAERGRLIDELAPAVAGVLGPPANAKPINDERELELWDREEPAVDVEQLKMQGLPPSLILQQKYPFRMRLIQNGRPNIEDQVRYAERMARKSAQRAKERLQQPPEGPFYV